MKGKPSEKRVINMQLELDLVDAIEIMAGDLMRDFHSTISTSLKWACWAHFRGRSPFFEMMDAGGFQNWDERIRDKREIRKLNELYRLETKDGRS